MGVRRLPDPTVLYRDGLEWAQGDDLPHCFFLERVGDDVREEVHKRLMLSWS